MQMHDKAIALRAKLPLLGQIRVQLAVLLLSLLPAPLLAQSFTTTPVSGPAAAALPGRPRIGLVLGGGGAKGFAHVGVIAELERRHIPIDVIAGTSMGAVVGSMYAIGNDAAQIDRIAHDIDWVRVFNDRLARGDLSFRRKSEDRRILLPYRLGLRDGKPVLPQGVLGGQRLYATVQELLAPWQMTDNFDRLPIPYRAVATDIATGLPVTMASGTLSTAVFASMSIPAAFPPIERDGHLLVDGGISDNLPIDVARAMGVDIVIVVDVGEAPHAADKIKDAISVFNQMQLLLGYDAIRRQRASLTPRDVLIEPDITGLSVTAFDKLDLGIERGKAAAVKMADQLAPLAVSDAQWAAYINERQSRRNPAPIHIDKVVVANTSSMRDKDLAPYITVNAGDTLDGARMARMVGDIYGLDEFDRVQYDVNGSIGNQVLNIDARGSRSSDKYFQTGMILGSNFGKSANFDIALAYTDRNVLGTGAEWRGFARVGSDVLFDVSVYGRFGRLFVEPGAFYERYSALLLRVGSTNVNDSLQVVRAGALLDGGVVLGNWGELRGGMRLGGLNPVEGSINTGVPNGWNRDLDWHIAMTYDTLDSLNFPRAGGYARVQFTDHLTALGGQFTRNELTIDVAKPISWDRTTLVLGARFGTTHKALNDFIGSYQLGGFLNISGLPNNSLLGQQLVMGRAVAFYRLSSKAPIMDLPLYVGGSIEAGNVFQNSSDISFGDLRTAGSIFVAADTPVGPVWLAYGRSGSSNGSIYLVLGRVF